MPTENLHNDYRSSFLISAGMHKSLKDLIPELVDNSIASGARKIIIDIEELCDEFLIRCIDDGSGIKEFGKALTHGKCFKRTKLNEHGVGLKTVLANAEDGGKGWSILTSSRHDAVGMGRKVCSPYPEVNSLKYETVKVGNVFTKYGLSGTGTCVEFSCTHQTFMALQDGIQGKATQIVPVLGYLKEHLGAVYRCHLNSSEIEIFIKFKSINGEVKTIPVYAVAPPFIKSKKVRRKFDWGQGPFYLELEFGAIEPSGETKVFYRRSQKSSGLEIRIEGRLIANNILDMVWGKVGHNSYNAFIACLNITSIDDNFVTLTKTRNIKTGFREDTKEFAKLLEFARSVIPDINAVPGLEHSKKEKRPAKKSRKHQEVVSKIQDLLSMRGERFVSTRSELCIQDSSEIQNPMRVDLKTYDIEENKDIIFEVKIEPAGPSDVAQLQHYLTIYEPQKALEEKKGILIAPNLSESAREGIRVLRENQNIDIQWLTVKEFAASIGLSDLKN